MRAIYLLSAPGVPQTDRFVMPSASRFRLAIDTVSCWSKASKVQQGPQADYSCPSRLCLAVSGNGDDGCCSTEAGSRETDMETKQK